MLANWMHVGVKQALEKELNDTHKANVHTPCDESLEGCQTLFLTHEESDSYSRTNSS